MKYSRQLVFVLIHVRVYLIYIFTHKNTSNKASISLFLTLPFFSFAVTIFTQSQYGWITTKAAPWSVTFMTSLTFSSTLHPGVMTLTMPGHHLPSIYIFNFFFEISKYIALLNSLKERNFTMKIRSDRYY